jgi:hypothetical protein
MFIDYDLDDTTTLLTDSFTHKINVGKRERRSLMRKNASLERFFREKEEKHKRFIEQSEHSQQFFQKVDYDNRYKYKRICQFYKF